MSIFICLIFDYTIFLTVTNITKTNFKVIDMNYLKFIFLLVFIVFADLLNAQWSNIDTITSNNMQDNIDRKNLIRDNNGTLHACWVERNPSTNLRKLFYITKSTGSNWSAPVNVLTTMSGAYYQYIGVSKQTGKPYIVFTKDSNSVSQVHLASLNGGVWNIQMITSNANDKYYPAVTIDNNGKVHLTWSAENASSVYKIFYCNDLQGSFTVRELSQSSPGDFGSGAAPNIAISSDGRAHITYRAGGFGDYDVEYAVNFAQGDTSWTYTLFLTPNTDDYEGLIEIGNDNTIHIVISGEDASIFPGIRDVYYVKKTTTGSWTTPAQVSSNQRGAAGSLYIDGNGFAHVALNHVSGNFITGNVYYASNITGSWTNTPVIENNQAYASNLTIDNNGKGHMLVYSGELFEQQEIFAIESNTILTTVENIGSAIPERFMLYQNYPNPFNPETKIKFSLPINSGVELKVFDITGKQVEVLVNGTLSQGLYEVSFDASGLTSGIYFYTLQTDNFTETRKMLLVK